MSQRTTGRSARRARSLFITAMLAASGVLAFSPAVPTATADDGSSGPVASADPSPEASPEPTTLPEPTPDPTQEPTTPPIADPTPASTPVAPEPAPDPTTTAGSGSTPPANGDPTPPANGNPTPPADGNPTPPADGGSTPPAEPAADPPAEPSARGHALGLDAAGHGAAVAATGGGAGLRTFTIETWFARTGPGAAIADVTAGADPLPRTDAPSLLGAIPLAARGTPDESTSSSPAPPGDRVDWLLGIDAADGVLVAGFHDADGRVHRIVGTTIVTEGAWHHAAATFDGAAFRLFLDGHLEAAIRADGVEPDASGSGPIALGTSVGANGRTERGAFDGILDETRLWSIARTGPDIRDDMRRAIDAAAVGLVGGWSMDEGQGSVLVGGTDPSLRLELRGATAWLDSPVPDPVPPSPPGSLMAVPNDAAISVGWPPVDADDLAGYWVRRTSGADVDPAAVPLGGWTPITATAFLDRSAVVGVTYRYTVVAVDRYGNESDPSPVATATLRPAPGAPPTVAVQLDLSASGPSPSGRLAPGASAVAHVAMTPSADLAAATLGLSIPAGWAVTDPAGGALADGSTLTWPVSGAGASRTRTVDVGLQAPLASPVDGRPTFVSTLSVWLEQPGGLIAGPSLTLLVAPDVVADHVMIGRPGDASTPASYAVQDEPVAGLGRFTPFRIRFRVENHDDVAIRLVPTLEFRDLGGGPPADFSAVPAGRVMPGAAMYAAREWVPVDDVAGGSAVPGADPGGSVLGGDHATIAVADLRTTGDPTDTLAPVAGVAATGRNPASVLELPPGSFSEVEFTVRATVDAPYGTAYAFRLSDDGVPLAGMAVATVALGPEPPTLLSPDQRHGLVVGGPTAGTAAPDEIRYRLAAAAGASDAAPSNPSPEAPTTAAAAASTDGAATAYPLVVEGAEVHGASGAGSGACAVCHDTHAAGGRSLLNRSGPQAAVCFTCHDSAGTGASSRVEAEYVDPAVPADDPASGSYYRHDALMAGTDHSLSSSNEFGGRLDRHAECADCHDPHSVSSNESVQTAGGWTVSGRLGGASGVAVANGPAGSEPSYTFVDGAATGITLEYQLCFKCHSGFTALPARSSDHPSRWAEDKGFELNPDNASYHPIEAAGRNGTDAMAASLGGTSPYKLWEFDPTSTIRCVNCHGDSRVLGGSLPAAGSDLAPHAVASVVGADGAELNRGLLIQPYRDRVLKGSDDAYDPQDSALCLSCHGQAPFVDATGNARSDTAFRFHGLHVAGLAGKGAIAGDIDTPSAGLGNALCSECHYRIHSTASRNDFRTTTAQTGTDGGLVLFAPNVIPSDPSADPLGGAIDWTRTGPSTGTCTLTCHGQVHSQTPY